MASRMNDNPWNEDSSLSGISLGKPQDVLTTLRNCGLKIVSDNKKCCIVFMQPGTLRISTVRPH